MQKLLIKQLLTYGLIGILNTLIHGIVFFSLTIVMNQAGSNLLAFLVAVCFSFFMNATFTFKKKPTPSRFLKMTLIMAFFSYGFGFLGDFYKLDPFITIIIYFVLNPIIGFILTKYIVFSK